MTNLSTERLLSLLEASRVISSTLDLDRLFTLLPDLTQNHLCAEYGVLYLYDDVRGDLWSRLTRGNRTREVRVPADAGLTGATFRGGVAVNAPDAAREPRVDKRIDAPGIALLRSFVAAPVRAGGGVAGVLVAANRRSHPFDAADEEFLCGLAEQVALALENVRVHRAALSAERSARDLEVAGEIQQHLLPTVLPNIHGYQVSASAVPARSVGGDIYDVIALPEGIVVAALGDVAGKGIPAALLMSTLHASYRAYLEGATGLVNLMTRLNALIVATAPVGRYVGLVLLALDTTSHRLSYVNAGHVPPLLFRSATEEFERLTACGPALGLVGEAVFEQAVVDLHHGDIVTLYSDGITDVANRAHQTYGEDRLRTCIRAEADRTAGDLHAATLQDLAAFARDAAAVDDTTLVVLKRV